MIFLVELQQHQESKSLSTVKESGYSENTCFVVRISHAHVKEFVWRITAIIPIFTRTIPNTVQTDEEITTKTRELKVLGLCYTSITVSSFNPCYIDASGAISSKSRNGV